MDYPGKSRVFYRDMSRNYPIIERGSGVFLYDEQGNEYLDAAGGIGVVNIGHGVKEIAEVAKKQMETLAFAFSGAVASRPTMELAEKLAAMAPPGMGEVKVFFSSGGSEANEAALKLARTYYLAKGIHSKYRFVSRWQGYHGNTMGTLSITGRTRWREPYLPLLLNFPHIYPPICYHCPFDSEYPRCDVKCAWELERILKQEGPNTFAGFMAEPIIGTSATAVTPPQEYYEIIRSICDKYDLLMVSDEVITGIGRTGKNFGIDHWDVVPDMITTAKALSGGYAPLAALIVSEKVWRPIWEGPKAFYSTYTFAGHPFSCAIGCAVLDYIDEHKLIERSAQMGANVLEKFKARLLELPYVGEVRGKGMLLGIELVEDKENRRPFPPEKRFSDRVADRALELGVFIIPGVQGTVDGEQGDHLQITPPFILEEEQANRLTDVLYQSILDVGNEIKNS